MNASMPHPNADIARLMRRGAARALSCLALVVLGAGCSLLGRSGAGEFEPAASPGVVAEMDTVRSRMAANPAQPYWPFRLGELYAAADSTEAAATSLRHALDVDPGYAPAATLLSKLYYDMRAHGAAVTLLEDVVRRNPDAPDAVRVALALHLDALGDVDGARAALAGCSQDDPDTRDARMFLALRDGAPESILDDARRAVEHNPKSAAAHNNYGITLLRAGRPGDARRSFMAALDIDPELAGALYNLAIVETFYFFDETAGRRWFDRYRRLASEDPDDLASALGTDMTRLVAPEEN